MSIITLVINRAPWLLIPMMVLSFGTCALPVVFAYFPMDHIVQFLAGYGALSVFVALLIGGVLVFDYFERTKGG